jgi:hypothetical protein
MHCLTTGCILLLWNVFSQAAERVREREPHHSSATCHRLQKKRKKQSLKAGESGDAHAAGGEGGGADGSTTTPGPEHSEGGAGGDAANGTGVSCMYI